MTNQEPLTAEDVIDFILATTDGRREVPNALNTEDMSQIGAVEAYAAQKVAKATAGLRTQLDEANARLAMLSEKLAYYHQDAFHEHGDGFYENMAYNGFFEEVEEALNATKEHVEAWKIAFQTNAIDLTAKMYESELEQLATVTNERDALREAALGFAPHKQTLEEKLSFIEYMSREGAGDPATKALLARLHKALAQKGGEA